MSLIKTVFVLFATAAVVLIFVPLGLVFFIINIIGFKRLTNWVIYRLAQIWARMVVFLSGCPMTVTGREYIPNHGGICFVSNHVGAFDIILALAYIGRPFGFIAKKELLLLPGINLWIYLLGGLFIDRKNPRKALKTISLGIKRIKAGGSMLIFPEGTRSRGQEIGTFHPGALKLASSSNALIVPVAISGSYEVFEKNYRVNSVAASIQFLPPVNLETIPQQDRKILLAEKLHSEIEQALKK